MIDNKYKYIELLHGEIDGLNSPQESALLTAYLAANPEAQRLYNELRGMSNMLTEVKPVEPPVHLQYAVMNAVSQRRSPRVVKHDRFAAFKNWLIETFEPKYAFSFAGGLAVGVLLFALVLPMIRGEKSAPNNLYGTIGAPHTEARTEGAKSQAINHEMAHGEIKWHRAHGLLVTEITLTAVESFDLVISFDPNQLSCNGVALIDGAELPDAVLQSGRLQFSHAGEKGYRIVLQENQNVTPVVHVQFEQNGKQRYDETFSLKTID